MKIAVLRERRPGERRVALTPESVKKLVASGHAIAIECGAGTSANYPDAAYGTAGATIADDTATMLSTAEMLLAVNPPELDGVCPPSPAKVMRPSPIG